MSWFARSFSLNERTTRSKEERATEVDDDGDDEEEEEEEDESAGLDLASIASATGKGVKEDLSQLTKSFTRQLWGVASFLAPPPPDRSSSSSSSPSAEAASQEHLLRSSSKDDTTTSSSGGEGVGVKDSQGRLVQSEADSTAGGRATGIALPGESDLRATSSSPRKLLDEGSAPTTPRGGPRLTGLRSDFAELRGTVATGFSRISSSVIRVVAGDDSGDDEEDERFLTRSKSDNVQTPRFSSEVVVDQTSKSSTRGFDSFLKPLLGNMLVRDGSYEGDGTSDDEDEGLNTRKVKQDVNLKSRGTDSLPSAFASGIDGISKFLLQIVQDEDYDEKEDESDERLDAVGLTEAVVTFARNIAMHPETWLDFPLPEDENDDDFVMNNIQKEHSHALEVAAPGLKALRIELCPNYMSEGRFWLNYFVLLHSRLSPEEAHLLSTSQVLSARASLLRELEKRGAQSGDLDGSKDHDRARNFLQGEIDLDTREAQVSDVKKEEVGKLSVEPIKQPVVPEKVLPEAPVSVPSSLQEERSVIKNRSESDVVIRPAIAAEDKTVAAESNTKPGVKRFPALILEDDEAEVDEWLDDEPSTKQHVVAGGQSQSDLGNMDEDVSFSDFEDDDPSQKVAGVTELSTSLNREVVNSTTTLEAKRIVISSVKEEKGDGSQAKSSDRGDSDDWLTVDQEDVVSTSSSP
ncbi:hypothetical protein MPTK1_8g09240 [Marchantia polymorpha subsp. ruderalis]|uniref:BSD domain-containing protein n=2 Tax=Marchantia polymorpha TaxID=3197 RepID=A0A176W3N6_MARPO|nr:hypothetical protein AXG93_473s1240 [Marchantia polymorpha subsp. ruderalis]PTQ28023.1 hypothetical protein MARPO_0176s0007 [Marchantia polymorpha]BBN19271.1 hypothetical protein Mp_8g09240 [Marchantia polymorpha subsp. ruderalis]|eukprot:PTQ28023.1 hypothetical protein MARPO_0176s0007 [Marchantia polymorpha]